MTDIDKYDEDFSLEEQEKLTKQHFDELKKCCCDVKCADVPYEEHMKVVYENDILKKIIIELTKEKYKCV